MEKAIKRKDPPGNPKIRNGNGLIQMIRMDKSTGQKGLISN